MITHRQFSNFCKRLGCSWKFDYCWSSSGLAPYIILATHSVLYTYPVNISHLPTPSRQSTSVTLSVSEVLLKFVTSAITGMIRAIITKMCRQCRRILTIEDLLYEMSGKLSRIHRWGSGETEKYDKT